MSTKKHFGCPGLFKLNQSIKKLHDPHGQIDISCNQELSKQIIDIDNNIPNSSLSILKNKKNILFPSSSHLLSIQEVNQSKEASQKKKKLLSQIIDKANENIERIQEKPGKEDQAQDFYEIKSNKGGNNIQQENTEIKGANENDGFKVFKEKDQIKELIAQGKNDEFKIVQSQLDQKIYIPILSKKYTLNSVIQQLKQNV